MRRRGWLGVVLSVLPLVGCLEADLTLRADGGVSGTLSWDTPKPMTEAEARPLFTASGVTIKRFTTPGPDAATPRVVAEIEATGVAALAGMPLLRAVGASASLGKPDQGKRVLTVEAAKMKDQVDPVPAGDNVVRLHLPGKVIETTGTAAGADVTWKVSGSEFDTKPSVALKVTFAAED